MLGRLVFIPLKTPVMKARFDVAEMLVKTAELAGETLRDGDVVIVSGKFIAMADGRIVRLSDISPSAEAVDMAGALEMKEELAELVLQEADEVYNGVPGFALAVKDGIVAPNAGIDRSNIQLGHAILYPREPFKRAKEIRNRIRESIGVKVALVISDSRLMPTRRGTNGVAIGVAGLVPVNDERGRKDLFGNILRYTQRAIADDLCSAAQLLMGEADEATPIVIARYQPAGSEPSPWVLTDSSVSNDSIVVGPTECIFMKGLAQKPSWGKRKALSQREAQAGQSQT